MWEWAVSEVNARVGPPPSADVSALVLAKPIEEVAGGVESFWVGIDDAGAHTLVVRDDEAGWVFLGEPGRLVAAGSAAGLMAFVCHGQDPLLDTEPWQALRGRDDVDFEPYEDNVVDLDELGRSLGPGSTVRVRRRYSARDSSCRNWRSGSGWTTSPPHSTRTSHSVASSSASCSTW